MVIGALLAVTSSFGAPPVERAPTVTIAETEPSTDYYRGPRSARAAILRTGVGLGWRLPVGDAGGKVAFGVDVLAGGRVAFGNGRSVAAVWPEIGWSWVGSDGHFLSAGLGPALQRAARKDEYDPPFSYAVVPRALYGTFRDQRAVGLRVSLLAEWIRSGTTGFELAYQLVRVETTDVHEVRFALTSGLLFGRKDPRP